MSDPWGGRTRGSSVMDMSLHHLSWQDDARCKEVGTDMFYVEPKEANLLDKAKRICNGTADRDPCPIRDACLDYAIETHESWGVWGGMSPRQRAREATERRRAAGTLGQRKCVICSRMFPGGPNHRNCSTECEREARRLRRAQSA